VSDAGTAAEIMRMTGGVGADVVFDFVSVGPALTTAAACIGSDGQITAVGLGGGEIPFWSEAIPTHLPWGTTISRPYGGRDRSARGGGVSPRRGDVQVHVQRFDLTEAAQVLEKLEQGGISGRAVLVP
jgi:propanol-preferring alcohol dehydrogenase